MAAEPTSSSYEPIAADESEVDAVKRVGQFLNGSADDNIDQPFRLTTPDGQAVDIPVSIRKVLQQVVPLLAQGDAVTVAPSHKEMTTQEAADFLNVSRPFLIKALEDGTIPYTKVGTHRRIRFDDVLAYRQQRSEARKGLFKWMLDVAQERNAYD